MGKNAAVAAATLCILGVGAKASRVDARSMQAHAPQQEQVDGGRQTIFGEPCAFPFEYEGEELNDCLLFDQEEWCILPTGEWAPCVPRDGDLDDTPMGPQVTSDIVINEIVHKPIPEYHNKDWIELKNLGSEDKDLQGYVLKDDKLDRPGFVIGETSECRGMGKSIIPANGYLLVIRDDDCGFTFGLASDEETHLFDPDGNLVDTLNWEMGDAPRGISWGRIPDGTGAFTNNFPTPLEANRLLEGA